jgi:hypothetical protein
VQNTKSNNQPKNAFDLESFTSFFNLAKFIGQLVPFVIGVKSICPLQSYHQETEQYLSKGNS